MQDRHMVRLHRYTDTQIHRWLSDLLVATARVSFWKAASAPGVTGEWRSPLGEAKEKVVTGSRAPGAETVLFRLRNSSLLFLSHFFDDSLFFFFFPGTGAGCVLTPADQIHQIH